MEPSKEHLEKTRCGPWKTWDSDRDIQVRVERQDGDCFITFQGSQSDIDWRINFTFWIKPYKNMPVPWYAHRGFALSYKAISDRVRAEARGSRKVYVAGFSQGAAYAVLAHEDLAFSGMDVETIAYAAPRVFWFKNLRKIADRFQGLTIVKNRGDVITMVPPAVWGYRHVGTTVKIGRWIQSASPGPWWHLPKSYKRNLK